MNLTFGKFVDRWLGIPLVALARGLSALASLWRREDPVQVERILLVKLWGAGNIVLLLPIIRRLRERFPEARISVLTLRSNRDLLQSMPEVDRIVTLDIASFTGFALSAWRALRELRREAPDVALDFEQFCRLSALLVWISGARQRIGLKTPGQARAGLYTASIPYRNEQHMSETFLDVARVLGVSGAYRPERVSIPDSARTKAAKVREEAEALTPKGPVVIVHVGSGDNFVGRRWPEASFVELISRLQVRDGARIIMTGVPAERRLVNTVIESLAAPAIDVVGRLDLLEFAALVEDVDALFCNDTLPVHLASASGCPVFAFYGPNTPALYGPLHAEGEVFYHDLPCSPCLTNLNAKESSCRLPVCIQSIEVDAVDRAWSAFWKAEGSLEQRPSKSPAPAAGPLPRDLDVRRPHIGRTPEL